MANQSIAGVKEIPGPSPREIERQIPFNVDTNLSWPQSTAPKKSNAAEVGASQGRHDLALFGVFVFLKIKFYWLRLHVSWVDP